MTDSRKLMGPRRRVGGRDARSDQAAAYLDSLIQRVASASTDEITEVILDLRRMRDALNGKSERWSGDIAGYASSAKASGGGNSHSPVSRHWQTSKYGCSVESLLKSDAAQ